MTLHRREILTAGALAPLLAACAPSRGGTSPSASGTSSTPAPASTAPSSAASAPSSAASAPSSAASTTSTPSSATPTAQQARELAGRCLLVGMQVDSDPGQVADLVAEHRLDGAFFLGNWQTTQAIRDAASGVHAAARRAGTDDALVAADQEGGLVHNLRSQAFTTVPSAERLGKGDPATAQKLAATTATQMSSAGLNMVLAPVADVVDPDVGAGNAPVGALHRGYGTSPELVSRFVTAAVKGFRSGGVATSIKHFPGLGAVRSNTDLAPATDRATGADSPTLASFKAGIAAGSSTVMVSSAVYTRIDADSPAAFSRAVITDLLRGRLGFDGVVVSDDLGAAKAVADTPARRRAARFVAAGGDLALCADPSLIPDMIDGLVEAAAQPAFAAALRASAARVDALVRSVGR